MVSSRFLDVVRQPTGMVRGSIVGELAKSGAEGVPIEYYPCGDCIPVEKNDKATDMRTRQLYGGIIRTHPACDAKDPETCAADVDLSMEFITASAGSPCPLEKQCKQLQPCHSTGASRTKMQDRFAGRLLSSDGALAPSQIK